MLSDLFKNLSKFFRKGANQWEDEIKLEGEGSGKNNQWRADFLTTLLNNSREKENHIDKLRQHNMSVALVIFSGLFAFGLKSQEGAHSVVSLLLSLLMLVFCALDRILHRFSHGWRGTWAISVEKLRDVINSPSQSVSFPMYYKRAEEYAGKFAFQPVIYYLLVIGGAFSWLAFRWASR